MDSVEKKFYSRKTLESVCTCLDMARLRCFFSPTRPRAFLCRAKSRSHGHKARCWRSGPITATLRSPSQMRIAHTARAKKTIRFKKKGGPPFENAASVFVGSGSILGPIFGHLPPLSRDLRSPEKPALPRLFSTWRKEGHLLSQRRDFHEGATSISSAYN